LFAHLKKQLPRGKVFGELTHQPEAKELPWRL
jgi:hypothetical protein